MTKLLFAHVDLDDMLRESLRLGVKKVDEIPEPQFCSSSDDQVVDHICASAEMIPIELHMDDRSVDLSDTSIDVRGWPGRDVRDSSQPCMIRGVRMCVTIPFTGNVSLFNYRPNPFDYNPPRATIIHDGKGGQGSLEIVVEYPLDMSDDPVKFKQEADQTIGRIAGYLHTVNGQVAVHNQNLRDTIQRAAASRRKRVGMYSAIVEYMNIPVKQRVGAPAIAKVRIKRRIVKPLPAKPPAREEFGIEDNIYDHILNVIRHEGCSYESTPQTFQKFKEEELRNIIVSHLNGHFEGKATGETFRNHGKTDIRIEEKNRAAFVGECKIWAGPRALSDAMDQMLGYLTWRDCKAALIVFNKNVAGFSKIQDQIPQIMEAHNKYVSAEGTDYGGEWRFKMRSADDEDRIIIVHVFLFNLYVRPE